MNRIYEDRSLIYQIALVFLCSRPNFPRKLSLNFFRFLVAGKLLKYLLRSCGFVEKEK